MSLINQVLQDLDARSSEHSENTGSVYEGMRPAPSPLLPKPKPWTGMLIMCAIAAVSYSAISFWLVPLPGGPKPASIALATTVQPYTIEPKQVIVSDRSQTENELKKQTVAKVTISDHSVDSVNRPSRETVAQAKPAEKIAVKPRTRKPVSSSTAMIKTKVPRSASEQADNYYSQAVTAMNNGQHDKAEKLLASAIENNPKHGKAIELLAGVYIGSGRPVNARTVLADAVAQLPNNLQLAMLLARVDIDLGQETRALDVLAQSSEINPNAANLLSFQAALHQRASQHQQAIDTYQKALKINPNEGRWWVGMAISLEAMADKESASQSYNQALQTPINTELARYAHQRLDYLKNNR